MVLNSNGWSKALAVLWYLCMGVPAGLLPAVESVFIPEASHRMHGDNPQAYNAAVSEFLQRIPEMS
jgi:pimeloyl-ACP methyl ester carboxylesterase